MCCNNTNNNNKIKYFSQWWCYHCLTSLTNQIGHFLNCGIHTSMRRYNNLKEDRDSSSDVGDKLVHFTGLVHFTQHRSLNLAWKKQAVLELSVERINLYVHVYKMTWVYW